MHLKILLAAFVAVSCAAPAQKEATSSITVTRNLPAKRQTVEELEKSIVSSTTAKVPQSPSPFIVNVHETDSIQSTTTSPKTVPQKLESYGHASAYHSYGFVPGSHKESIPVHEVRPTPVSIQVTPSTPNHQVIVSSTPTPFIRKLDAVAPSAIPSITVTPIAHNALDDAKKFASSSGHFTPYIHVHEAVPIAQQVSQEIYQVTPEIHRVAPRIHRVYQVIPQTHDIVQQTHEIVPQAHQVVSRIHHVIPDSHQVPADVHQVAPEVYRLIPQPHQSVEKIYQVVPRIHHVALENHELSSQIHESAPRQVAQRIHYVTPQIQHQQVAPEVHQVIVPPTVHRLTHEPSVSLKGISVPTVQESSGIVHQTVQTSPVHAEDLDDDRRYFKPAHYEFEYTVYDPHTHDIKHHKESRENDVVKGSYSFIEPDGAKRVVEYTADHHNGFNAVVRREESTHPVPHDAGKTTSTDEKH